MNFLRTLALLSALFAIPILSISQVSIEQINKELESLDGSLYIKRAVEGANQLVKNGRYDDSEALLNRAVKEAKSKGNSTYAVVLMTKAQMMSSKFPHNNDYNKEVARTLDECLKKLKSPSMLKSALKIYYNLDKYAESRLKIGEKIASIEAKIGKVETDPTKIEKQAIASNVIIKNKVEDNPELVKLRAERERLENVTLQLSESVALNEKQLSLRKSIIRKMSREKSDNEAIIQYNHRIIDSLEFSAKLDSINILNNEHLISQQNAKLDLAQAELEVKESQLQLKSSQQRLYLVLSILGLLTAGFLSFIIVASRKANSKLKESQTQIEKEKERAEELLLNILPEFIALELKEKATVETKYFEHCTVMFTDFINFSNISKQLSPKELIESLDECFREFDRISSSFNIEKIKTIGDSYMCASGLPVANKTHALDAIHAAQKMVTFLESWNKEREKNNKIRFDARIGIHSGPVIAGVVGFKKFAYDIWGDTVNIAARIESQSSAQRINISSSTYELTKGYFNFESRGDIAVKNMDELKMYYLENKDTPAIPRISNAS